MPQLNNHYAQTELDDSSLELRGIGPMRVVFNPNIPKGQVWRTAAMPQTMVMHPDHRYLIQGMNHPACADDRGR